MPLNTFFESKSVAVIGASRCKGKIGYEILLNFAKGEFKGKVFPVNPKTKKILGLKCYPSVISRNKVNRTGNDFCFADNFCHGNRSWAKFPQLFFQVL